MKIYLFVLTECTNVTDGHTHTHRHRMTAKAALDAHASIARQKLLSVSSRFNADNVLANINVTTKRN